MNAHKPYAEFVRSAEEAVSAVADPEFKKIAFERVLNDLIADNQQGGPSPTQAGAAGRKPTRSTRSSSSTKRQPSLLTRDQQGGPLAYVTDLANEGFFASQKNISDVKGALDNRGHHIPLSSLSGPLQILCQRRILRRQKVGKTYSYSNW